MKEEIYTKLQVLGYDDLSSMDEVLIESIFVKLKAHVQSFCNISEVPEEILPMITNAVCGEFLLIKKNAGLLESLTSEQIIKSIDEGDVKLTFMDSESGADKMDKLINWLLLDDQDLLSFRRLQW